ncbi:MAG TPA: hypothetical protein VHM30_01245 [Gemmatimonadaceae bacterium]|nr:hypothetical protein [Gemmatimonadaceae bacterium]
MPLVDFDSLPDDARVWVFGSDRPLAPDEATRLLAMVDAYLARWAAHGEPLRSGRDWRDDRFLTIAVDQRTAGASGCSIDALFRQLQQLERELGASLVGGGRVFYRDGRGALQSTDRGRFTELATRGEIGPATLVYDPTVQTLGAWRRSFERPVAESWHAALI